MESLNTNPMLQDSYSRGDEALFSLPEVGKESCLTIGF